MDRRHFLKTAAAGGALAATGPLGQPRNAYPKGHSQPNILFIIVDEMRYPTVFPSVPPGISTVDEFLAAYMPNTYELLWEQGVKFANHHTASSACSPARGAFVTGLYSQQNWLTQTVKEGVPGVSFTAQPQLSTAFPTYGKLLRQAGYQTPYIGKWHTSVPIAPPSGNGLEGYGFDYQTYPDPTGANLQGTLGYEPNFHSDQYIEDQATAWLGARVPQEEPWCLTVSFINPHDQQLFPAGTEYQTFAALFPPPPGTPQQLLAYADLDLGKDIPYDQNPLRDPPNSYGYPTLPPNWESAEQIAQNKPFQNFSRIFQQAAFGGVTYDPSQTGFTTTPYPQPPGQYAIGIAPYNYWQRALDSYTYLMQQVDGHIGAVINSLPDAVAPNTIIVFLSDHGEFAGAHGFVAGKTGTCYEEVWKVPLIVVDPTGQFAGDINTVRNQLTSSIDLLPMLVSLAYGGSRRWMTRELEVLYGQRFDMIPLLRSAHRPGRPYVVFATDELVPTKYTFDHPKFHIVGLITENAKLGVYSRWLPATTTIDPRSIDIEFYDYNTPGGLAELDTTPDDPRARAMLQRLFHDIIPNELRAPLPSSLLAAQNVARAKYLFYATVINNLGIRDTGFAVGL